MESINRLEKEMELEPGKSQQVTYSVKPGHFQNVEDISDVTPIVARGLSNDINWEIQKINSLLRFNLEELGSNQVIHIRRNDSTQPENTPFGIPKPDFFWIYLDLNQPINSNINDEKRICNIIKKIAPTRFIESKYWSLIQDVALGTKSNKLMASNYTVAHGGILLRASRGASLGLAIPKASTVKSLDAFQIYNWLHPGEEIDY